MYAEILNQVNPYALISANSARHLSAHPEGYTLLAQVNTLIHTQAMLGNTSANIEVFRDDSYTKCREFQHNPAFAFLIQEVSSRGFTSNLVLNKDTAFYIQLTLSWN